jgi:hypothetical protein
MLEDSARIQIELKSGGTLSVVLSPQLTNNLDAISLRKKAGDYMPILPDLRVALLADSSGSLELQLYHD